MRGITLRLWRFCEKPLRDMGGTSDGNLPEMRSKIEEDGLAAELLELRREHYVLWDGSAPG